MDKKTISHYGWVVVVTLILAVLLALATPLGTYIGDGVVSIAQGFVATQNESINDDAVQDKIDKYEGLLNNCTHENVHIVLQKDATCEKDGYTGDKVCKDCRATVEQGQIIKKGAHIWSSETVIKAATCNQTGISQKVCSVCKKSIETEIEKTAHSKFYTKSGRPVTCTTDGETDTVYCGVCNTKIEVGQQILALGHKEIKGGTESVHSKCSECGLTLSTAHKYTKTTLVNPTCSVKGKWKFTCDCGYSYEEEDTKQPEHTIVNLSAVPATCTKTGLTEGSYCSVCDMVFSEQKEIPAKGHNLTEINLNVDYVSHYECENCDVMIMPEGAVYYVQTAYANDLDYSGASQVITGDGKTVEFPKTVNFNDVYKYKDYEYYYGYGYCGCGRWSSACDCNNFNITGWGVRCINSTKSEPCDILESINNKNILATTYTFYDLDNIEVVPLIPENVIKVDGMFELCVNLKNFKGNTLLEGEFANYVIPNTVVSMNYMFSNCKQIQLVPNLPSKIETLDWAFNGCSNLYYAYSKIPNTIKSMEGTFFGCSLYYAPDISNCNKLTNLERCFQECKLLISAPSLPTNVNNLKYTFSGCASLNTYDGNGDGDGYFYNYIIPSNVTELYGTFQNCDNIIVFYNIPSTVLEMQYTFYDCDGLQSFDTPMGVKNISYICYDCDNLYEVYIHNHSNLENISYAFYNCDVLYYVNLYNQNSIEYMNYAFYSCDELYDFYGKIPATVKEMQYAFAYTALDYDYRQGVSVYIDANPTVYNNCFLGAKCIAYIDGESSILNELAATDNYIDLSDNDKIRVAVDNPIPYGDVYYISYGTTDVTDDTKLVGDNVSVAFPDSVYVYDTYESGDYRYSYKSYYDVYYDEVPAEDSASWYRIDEKSNKYYMLGTDVYLGCDCNNTYDGINHGHEYNWYVHHINPETKNIYPSQILETVNGLPVDAARCAFKEFDNITTSPKIPDFITNIQDAYNDCSNLISVGGLPQNTIFMAGAFAYCSSLSVTPELPNTVKDLHACFRECYSLTDLPTIPSGASAMTDMFAYCSSLQGIIEINTENFKGVCSWQEGGSPHNMFYGTVNDIYVTGSSPHLYDIVYNTNHNGNVHLLDMNNIIPTGGTYYVGVTGTTHGDLSGATATYTAGQTFPVPKTGDVFVYDGYEYRYGKYYSGDAEGYKNSVDEWSVKTLENDTNRSKTSFDDAPVLRTISGKRIQSMQYTYLRMDKLNDSTIYIPDTVLYMIGTFEKCTSLVNANDIKIPEGVLSTDSMFFYCEALVYADIEIPNSVESATHMFTGCYSLITAPSTIPESCKNTLQMFRYCESLTGNIEINCNMFEAYNDMFRDTTQPIYIYGACDYDTLKLIAATDGYEDLSINDNVQVLHSKTFETSHTPYENSNNYIVLGTYNFESAESVDIAIVYQTESTSFDWISITEGADYIAGKSYTETRNYLNSSGQIVSAKGNETKTRIGGSTKTQKVFKNVDMKSGSIIFRTDGSANNYYGATVVVTANYANDTKVIETPHYTYPNSINYMVLDTFDFANAKSVDITIAHEFESASFDWISITEGTNYTSGTSYSATRNYLTRDGNIVSCLGSDASAKISYLNSTDSNRYNVLTFENVDMTSGSVILRTDGSINTYYGARVIVTPNY